MNPRNSEYYNNRAVAYGQKHDKDHCIADYTQAIRLNPKSPMLFANRAATYQDYKEYENAIADYDQAIRLDNNYAAAYLERGAIYEAAAARLPKAMRGEDGVWRADYVRLRFTMRKGD